jgi:hypothetical protein
MVRPKIKVPLSNSTRELDFRLDKAREAADRLWQEIVREMNEAAPDQPASDRDKNRRGRSGQ